MDELYSLVYAKSSRSPGAPTNPDGGFSFAELTSLVKSGQPDVALVTNLQQDWKRTLVTFDELEDQIHDAEGMSSCSTLQGSDAT